jgi:hypothetical protein
MALGKVFNMGGLYQGPTKQAQPSAGWRRLLNVWQDRSGKFRPKGEQVAYATPVSPFGGTLTQVARTGFSRRFQDKIFSAHIAVNTSSPTNPLTSGNFFTVFDKTGADVTPKYNTNSTGLGPDRGDWVFGRNSFPNTVVGNKLFFKSGSLPLQKYDGTQLLRAGLPLPYIDSPQYNPAGTHWSKIVAVRLGFDGTLISSGFVKFPANPAANLIVLNLRYAAIASELVGKSAVSPMFRDSEKMSSTLLDDMGFIQTSGAWTYNAGAATLAINATKHNLVAGQWVMFAEYSALTVVWDNFAGYIYALKVKSIAGSTITFEANGRYYSKANLTWTEALFTDATSGPFYSGFTWTLVGCSTVLLAYSSATENGTYLCRAVIPLSGQEEAGAYTYDSVSYNITLTPFSTTGLYKPYAGQITSDLSGWYDTGTVKLQFPYLPTTINSPGILGLTKYQGSLISYDKKAIYFNDTSAGGSDEMVSGLTNFVPLGTEYGDIVAVEGCEDFIFISRERKNYVLVGDIATGNFVINECDAETASALGSNATIAVKGMVVYMGRQGIFAVSSSGVVTELSEGISRLFGASREFVTDPDSVAFQPYRITDDVAATSSTVLGWDGNIVKMKYDSDRNIVAILYGRKTAVGAAVSGDHYGVLAINLKTGNCYEWKLNQVADLDVVVHDVEFLESYDATTGKFKGSLIQSGLTITREDNTQAIAQDMYMISSWQTGDEPSLEKQATQVKFYGQMTGCRIFHQEEWETFTSIANLNSNRTNVLYPTSGNQNNNLFEHKQGINSTRAQAISIGFAPTDNNFSLEGYELEWELIQGAMKR